jgi:hypothetical protein
MSRSTASAPCDSSIQDHDLHEHAAPDQLYERNMAPDGSPRSSSPLNSANSELTSAGAERTVDVIGVDTMSHSNSPRQHESARNHHAPSQLEFALDPAEASPLPLTESVQVTDDLMRHYSYIARDPPPPPDLHADDSHISADDHVDTLVAAQLNAGSRSDTVLVPASAPVTRPHPSAPSPVLPTLHSSRGDEHSIDRQLHLLHQRLEAQQAQLVSPAARELALAQHAHLQALQHQRQQQQPRHRPGASAATAPSHSQASIAASYTTSSSSNVALQRPNASAALPAAGEPGPTKQRRTAADQQASITDPELAKVCWRPEQCILYFSQRMG